MIVKVEPAHILHVCQHLRADDLREISETRWSGDDIAESLWQTPGGKFAIIRDGSPVALLGVVPVWPGVGQAWLIATPEVGNYGVEVMRVSKRIIKTLLDLEMHRIHAYSAAFHTQAHRWLEMTGFRRESTLKQYGKTGEDFYCYAITRPVSK